METNAPASAATTDADPESSERVDRNALRDDIRNHLETIGLNGARGGALSGIYRQRRRSLPSRDSPGAGGSEVRNAGRRPV